MIRLAFDGVGKRFPGVVALDGVSFAVAGGEVRALMGENGAGKSTLLKILAGEQRPDAGGLVVDGMPIGFASPAESQAAGIAIIHQELHLAPNLTVAENLLLGHLPSRRGMFDRAAARSRAAELLAQLGESIDPEARVGSLPIAKQQMVEIGKALARNARIIAFDEPTSSLSARETATLMAIIRRLRADGCAILYVSHRMEEVFDIADSVSVLRDGRHVADFDDMAALNQERLIAAMVGRSIEDIYAWRGRPLGDVALEVSGLEGPGLSAPLDLSVRHGEILGFFGLVGAGRSELFRLLYGAVPPTAGHVTVDGDGVDARDPRAAIAAGFGLCPESRKEEGIVPLLSVAENIAVAPRNANGRILLDRAAEQRSADVLVDRLRIKTASTATPIGTLSGGNQQKAILARWLAAEARILLLDEPTRGIDVAARSEIYDQIYGLAETGRAILFASSDMPEVLGVADRIVVMREGRIAGIVPRAAATPDLLLRLALPDGNRAAMHSYPG